MSASLLANSGSYRITLFTHGRRALLTSGSPNGRPAPTAIGNAAITAWQTLVQSQSRLTAHALYLLPSSICMVVALQNGADDPLALRLLYDSVRHFKEETTRRYNHGSTQDYHSRLWQASLDCKLIAIPNESAALDQQMTAEGAYRAI